MVLDSKTAVAGMLGGLELCYRTVVPAMFPFLFLSSLLLSELSGKQNRMLQSLAKRLGIPPGGEGILVVGLLGGYPTGAASVADFYKHNKLQRHHAERLLGFCNNAGPAFIFGMAGNLFPLKAAWVLWGIHILSAIITATILPQTTVTAIKKATQNHISASQALSQSLRVMSYICGWVILFKVLILFCNQWFLWYLPVSMQVLIQGLLELSNGCCSLTSIGNPAIEFILFSVFLSMGGICVLMQTASVASELSMRWYVIGKLIQSSISFLLSIFAAQLIFPNEIPAAKAYFPPAFIAIILLAVAIYVSKSSRFSLVNDV